MKIIESIANDTDALIHVKAKAYVAAIITEQNDPEAAQALEKVIVDGVIRNLANRVTVRLS